MSSASHPPGHNLFLFHICQRISRFLPVLDPGTGPLMQTSETNAAAPSTLSPPHGKRRLLNVDDEGMVRTVLKAILRYGGYQVTEAVDGKMQSSRRQGVTAV
jgi:hypothetical protein